MLHDERDQQQPARDELLSGIQAALYLADDASSVSASFEVCALLRVSADCRFERGRLCPRDHEGILGESQPSDRQLRHELVREDLRPGRPRLQALPSVPGASFLEGDH